MGTAVGQVLAAAVGVAISPLPLIVLVLLLSIPRGRANGIAFALGWIGTLTLLGAAMLLIGAGGQADTGGQSATWVSWLKLALGVLFALLALQQWRSRPREGREQASPKWMTALDTTTPWRAAGLAALLSGANPKNLALTIAAGAAISGAAPGTGARVVGLAAFVLIASLCVLVPLTVYLIGGAQAQQKLAEWKGWMSDHNTAIMVTVLAVLAGKYIGDALSALTS